MTARIYLPTSNLSDETVWEVTSYGEGEFLVELVSGCIDDDQLFEDLKEEAIEQVRAALREREKGAAA